jgi:adenylylsulfate kinase
MSGQVIWITGLSGAGKTTLANELIISLKKRDLQPILLDGDILRKLLKVPHKKIDSHTRERRIELVLKDAHSHYTL